MRNVFLIRNRQSGISMLSFLVVSALGILTVLTALRCLPAWIENASIERAVQKLETSGDTSPTVLRQNFSASAAVNDIKSITADDLTIEVIDKKVSIYYDYETRVKISDSTSIVFSFNRNQ